MLVKGANPIAVGWYRKEVYTFLRNAAPIIHWTGDFEDLHTRTLCYSEKGLRENVICNSLHVYSKKRSNTDLAIIGKSPKIHVHIGDSILYPAKLEFHINHGIAWVLIVSLLPHNYGRHLGRAGDLGINGSGHVSRHTDKRGPSVGSARRAVAEQEAFRLRPRLASVMVSGA